MIRSTRNLDGLYLPATILVQTYRVADQNIMGLFSEFEKAHDSEDRETILKHISLQKRTLQIKYLSTIIF